MKSSASLLLPAATLLFTACVTTPKAPTTVQSFQRADLDGSGMVSRAEYDSHMIGEIFARFDGNKDSVISEKEFQESGGTAGGFRKINTSGTGKLTLEEAKASAGVRKTLDVPFNEADTSRDRQISMAELAAYRKNALDYVR